MPGLAGSLGSYVRRVADQQRRDLTMSDDVKVTTNNVPRFTIDAYELTEAERAEFDYLDWPAIDEGRESATFVRYRGELYDLDQFTHVGPDAPEAFRGWHGWLADTFFSGILIKLSGDGELATVARYYS